MNRKLFIIFVVIAIVASAYFFLSRPDKHEQQVFQSTYDISKEYLSMRYRTDNLLINAKEYADYTDWDQDMTILIKDWQVLEQESQKLEESALKITETAGLNLTIIQKSYAYDSKEVQKIIESAPMGKQVRTLAKHLGVDAKRAQLILNESQDRISREIWGGEGDTFENLENTALVVKDGCKVAGFAGGVVLTGGAAGFAAAGTMTKVAVVIAGADLALEVTEDSAQIAFGDKNKVSSLVKDVRTVTEPIASVLAITSISSNLGTVYGKVDAVLVGIEQFRDTVQEGKVVGVDLTKLEYHKPFQRIRQAKYLGTLSVSQMEMAEVETWLQSLNKKLEPMTQAEVEDFLTNSPSQTTKSESTEKVAAQDPKASIVMGSEWMGTLVSVSGGNNEKHSTDLGFILNKDGTVSGDNFKKWKQEGNSIKLLGEDEKSGYYEFLVSDDSLTLSKIVIGDEVILPGQEYMGGVAPTGVLYPKTQSNNDNSEQGTISFKEWDAWGDADSRYKDDLLDKFGSADVTETSNGKEIWVYNDLVYYESGSTCSPVYTFYDTNQTATRRCLSAENLDSILSQE